MTSQMTSLQSVASSVPRRYSSVELNGHATYLRANDQQISARQPFRWPLVATEGRAARILVVDDLCTTRSLVQLLHGIGYRTTRAASCGEAALQLARDFLPSIVLLTLQLPQVSAYQVAARLRDQARGRKLRLIALTDDCAHAERDLDRQAGFERYLLKPVSLSALRHLLQAVQS